QAVINIDDPYGRRLADEHPDSWTVSFCRPARIRASEIDIRADGLNFLLDIDGRKQRLSAPLCGEHNLYNLLFALGGIACLDLDPFDFLEGVPHLTLPEGRWMVIGNSPTVVVDFAHSPDSFEQVLKLASRVAKGKIITVFGCTGNRDRKKRPIMGEIVSRYSQFTVLTTDSPGGEDPELITAETLPGIHIPYLVEHDREKAIAAAIEMAEVDDLVLILGRGHEAIFDYGAYTIPLYDPEVARRCWEKRHRNLI
ncbi:MAG: UDP-N-acetylmuramoyl-L-alanyl-D-glutamate--2,6-diaminopimelate ligase, partial [Firmicutes bacterium]|nr:UDP-N-acetylmuramoyl-L-alanyl-D-glutamate--2,6-diaminopimelate ligase [Bacillota bacterium]